MANHIRFKSDKSGYTASQDKYVLESWACGSTPTEIAAMRLGQNNGIYISPEEFVEFANSIGWYRKD